MKPSESRLKSRITPMTGEPFGPGGRIAFDFLLAEMTRASSLIEGLCLGKTIGPTSTGQYKFPAHCPGSRLPRLFPDKTQLARPRQSRRKRNQVCASPTARQ